MHITIYLYHWGGRGVIYLFIAFVSYSFNILSILTISIPFFKVLNLRVTMPCKGKFLPIPKYALLHYCYVFKDSEIYLQHRQAKEMM